MRSTQDRRIKLRVTCDYPAIIEGYDGAGNKYSENAKLVNLSASGLFMKANRYIDHVSILSVTVFLTSNSIEEDSPRITTHGVVVRVEPQVDGTCGVAVKFNHYRFQ